MTKPDNEALCKKWLREEERIDTYDCSSGKSTELSCESRIRIERQNAVEKKAQLYDMIVSRLAACRALSEERRAMIEKMDAELQVNEDSDDFCMFCMVRYAPEGQKHQPDCALARLVKKEE